MVIVKKIGRMNFQIDSYLRLFTKRKRARLSTTFLNGLHSLDEVALLVGLHQKVVMSGLPHRM